MKRVESDTNGRILNARYGVDGLRTKKQDAAGNSSREYGAGINTSASTPLTQNSTAPSISYISGPMILGAEINGEFVYHLGDALSTVRDVVDSSGNVIRSNEWDEYGNLISSSGSGQASPKTWVGGLSVNDDTADSKLYNMGYRNYAGGVLGRFISRDPIGFSGGLNLYSYPTNPVNFVDPSGLEVTVVFDIASGTLTVTSTEGDNFTITGIICGPNNDLSDIYREGGSTPPGEYYLGDPESAARTHPDNWGDLMWVPILNKATLGDQVYVTDPKTGKRVERNVMYLHAGRRSDGCVTFPSTGVQGELYNKDFVRLKEVLAKTTRINTGRTTMKFSPVTGPYISPVSVPGRLTVK